MPKVTLISRAQVLLQEDRLHFAGKHPLIETLRHELLDMRVKVSPASGRAAVALALLAQVDHFRDGFQIAAILKLSVVLFVGVATIARLAAINREDLRSVMGMNRLRRGYLEMHPELEPYFLTGSHDDLRGLMLTLDMDMVPGRWTLGDAGHGLQTLPAMLAVIVAIVAGVLGALIAGWFGAPMLVAVAIAAAVFLTAVLALGWWTRHSFAALGRKMPMRFPSPTASRSGMK